MLERIPPGLILVVGALLLPLLRGRLRQLWFVALPVLGLAQLVVLADGSWGHVLLFDCPLTVVRLDALSRFFGVVFHLAALLGAVYALHVRGAVEQVAAMVYAGAAVGAVCAGDLVTLFACWELAAVSSAVLVWARGTEQSYAAGMRYLLVQVTSGVLLLAGVVAHYAATGSLAFGHLGVPGQGDLGVTLIFIAFGIKAAFPLLHAWLKDAYPEATPAGTVFLSAFTTKMAVYALARGFAGVDLLVPIGAAMVVFPVFYAMTEDDLRRLLSYSLNSQLGFMVVGVGVGTPLALNGAVSHAAASTVYQSLLFMAAGAVVVHAGTGSARALGGLYSSLRGVAWCALVGAAAISALPLTSGFVTKSLTLSAVAEGHWDRTWLVLLLGAGAAFVHTGLRFPYLAFCRGAAPLPAGAGAPLPGGMLVAMALAALLTVAIGVFPHPLYGMLPYPVEYEPYTASHVLGQLETMGFGLLLFALAAHRGWLPRPHGNLLDADWVYRALLPRLARGALAVVRPVRQSLVAGSRRLLELGAGYVHEHHAPGGLFARTWGTASSVLIVVALLAVYLLYFLHGG